MLDYHGVVYACHCGKHLVENEVNRMARATIKLKRPITDFELDIDENSVDFLWIPCSERLPEEDDYRPCYEYDDGVVWWVNDIGQMGLGWYYSSTGTWAYYDGINGCEKRVGNVIAWMPLPEPYREDGAE